MDIAAVLIMARRIENADGACYVVMRALHGRAAGQGQDHRAALQFAQLFGERHKVKFADRDRAQAAGLDPLQASGLRD